MHRYVVDLFYTTFVHQAVYYEFTTYQESNANPQQIVEQKTQLSLG